MDQDQWIQQHATDGGFLQSTGWAEFQRALGRKTECIELPARNASHSEAGGRVTGGELRSLLVEQQLPFGQSYVYSPRGPVGSSYPRDFVSSYLLAEVQTKFPKAIFWRVEPVTELRVTSYELRHVKSVQPKTTLIIDLSKNEEDLLSQMKQKTRYNIKLAQKHGVVVTPNILLSLYPNIHDRFFDLLEETAKRDGFRTHEREYYKKLLSCRHREHSEAISGDCHGRHGLPRNDGDLSIELFTASHGDTLLAGAIVAFFGQWAYYLHGASSNEHREMMAPYVLHWEIMREAKQRGCTKYDLWGAGDQWPGVSKFKTGFAPATALTHYPGTFDVVLKPWKYWAYRLAQKLR